MNIEVLKTVVRQLALVLGTLLVNNGLADASLVEPLVGGIVAIASIVWGIVSKKKDQDIIKAA